METCTSRSSESISNRDQNLFSFPNKETRHKTSAKLQTLHIHFRCCNCLIAVSCLEKEAEQEGKVNGNPPEQELCRYMLFLHPLKENLKDYFT